MPRTPTLLLTAALAAVCCCAGASARAQQPPARDPSDALRKSLRAAEQDAALAEELYQQGEALVQKGRADASAAARTYGEALRLYLSLYTEKSLPKPSPGRGEEYRALMRERLRHAPECVERYLRLVGGVTEFERSQLEAFRGQALGLREEGGWLAVYTGSEVDTRAVITYKPEPGFTEEARRENVTGVVRLRAVLASDGAVRYVLVIKGLPKGLSEACVAAARGIKFTPAVREGRPVSQFVVLEYNFNTY